MSQRDAKLLTFSSGYEHEHQVKMILEKHPHPFSHARDVFGVELRKSERIWMAIDAIRQLRFVSFGAASGARLSDDGLRQL